MINRYDPQYIIGMQQEPDHSVKRPPVYEIIKTLTPILLVVFGYLGKMSRPVFYGFAALAVIGIYYEPMLKGIKSVTRKRHNRAVAKENMKQLRQLSDELANFLDISVSRSDNLQSIVNSISQRTIETTKNVHIPAPDIFHYQAYYLHKRIQSEHLSVEQFGDVVTEFYGLISGYNSYAVSPVFRILASENLLNAYEKSQLNGFHLRWVTYLGEYIKFAKQLNRDFRSEGSFSIGIGLPLPLA